MVNPYKIMYRCPDVTVNETPPATVKGPTIKPFSSASMVVFSFIIVLLMYTAPVSLVTPPPTAITDRSAG
jgi:hypothetical protein